MPERRGGAGHVGYPAGMKPRILVADDESDFVEILKFRLTPLHGEILTAANGVQALSLARQFQPDLILLDILLPDLDGLSVRDILRRQPATKKIPIIFISALSGRAARRTMTASTEDFFTKPLDWERLARRIDELLNDAPASRDFK
ncbi:MAG TPA: response regulator [Verrucomicrobiae bacterium]|nr:response regulator [Verrucomicrobiae bacterium]